jgi:serine phosphatase RsbU (regulator of sigma subunit)
MDIILCRFTKENNQLHFSGANRPLYIVRNKELMEMKTDKVPVGGLQVERNQFTTQALELQKGDCIYLGTDGYADQFGGTDGRKFMTRKLKELLVNVSSGDMQEQYSALLKTHQDWKGSLEQVDDILMIGIRI